MDSQITTTNFKLSLTKVKNMFTEWDNINLVEIFELELKNLRYKVDLYI